MTNSVEGFSQQESLSEDARARLAGLVYGDDPLMQVTDRQPEWASMLHTADKSSELPVAPDFSTASERHRRIIRAEVFWGIMPRQPEWLHDTIRPREFPDEP